VSNGLFISYRRTDQPAFTGRLYDRLKQAFPARPLFMDVDSIPAGSDFVAELEKSVRKSEAMVVVIGPAWLTASDDEGRPRIAQDSDFVHREVAVALARDVRVIPVLVDDTPMVGDASLPFPLKALARRNAVRIRNDSFHNDCESLIRAIRGAPVDTPAPAAARLQGLPLAKIGWIGGGVAVVAAVTWAILSFTGQPNVGANSGGVAAGGDIKGSNIEITKPGAGPLINPANTKK
jgi:hypothetical protein